MEFYYDTMSQPSRAVYILMKLNNIHFIPKLLDLPAGDARTPEFAAINPLARVPVIKEGDFLLNESNAILKYLATTKGAADFWYPKDVKNQAKVDEYLSFHQGNVRTKCYDYGVALLLPLYMKTKPDEEAVAKYKVEMIKILDIVESYFLSSSDFIVGNEITIADLLAVCELMQINMGTPVNVAEGRPNMAAWVERVKAKTAPYFDDAHARPKAALDKLLKTHETKEK